MDNHAVSSSATLRSIAKSLGISHVTVSLALRDDPKISQKRRQQIQQAAQEAGYRPNTIASALAYRKHCTKKAHLSSTLAWLNLRTDSDNHHAEPWFCVYWQASCDAAAQRGYQLQEFISQPPSFSTRSLARDLQERNVTGVLIPPHQFFPNWTGFPWEQFAVVRMGSAIGLPRANRVNADEVQNAITAFEKVHAKGYNRIGFLTRSAPQLTTLSKAGYLSARVKLGVEAIIPSLALPGKNAAQDRTLLKQWLRQHRPDALIFEGIDASKLLGSVGCRIPDDLGVATLDLADREQGVAGIYPNFEEVGRIAVLVLTSLINDQAYGPPPIYRQILIEGTWVDGATLPLRC